MRRVLDILIQLQQVDSKLQELEAEKGDLPRRVEMMQSELDEIQAKLLEQTLLCQEKEQRKKSLENDAVDFREKLKKYKSQLYNVKSNREYDAITLEIETMETKIDEAEFEALVIEEALVDLKKSIEEIGHQQEAKQQDLTRDQAVLQHMLEKTREHEELFLQQRRQIAAGVPKPILNTYDRIRIGRGGVAVAFLKNNACSECSSRIPPQRGLEIRNMDTLYYCETCGRILLYQLMDEVPVGNASDAA